MFLSQKPRALRWAWASALAGLSGCAHHRGWHPWGPPPEVEQERAAEVARRETAAVQKQISTELDDVKRRVEQLAVGQRRPDIEQAQFLARPSERDLVQALLANYRGTDAKSGLPLHENQDYVARQQVAEMKQHVTSVDKQLRELHDKTFQLELSARQQQYSQQLAQNIPAARTRPEIEPLTGVPRSEHVDYVARQQLSVFQQSLGNIERMLKQKQEEPPPALAPVAPLLEQRRNRDASAVQERNQTELKRGVSRAVAIAPEEADDDVDAPRELPAERLPRREFDRGALELVAKELQLLRDELRSRDESSRPAAPPTAAASPPPAAAAAAPAPQPIEPRSERATPATSPPPATERPAGNAELAKLREQLHGLLSKLTVEQMRRGPEVLPGPDADAPRAVPADDAGPALTTPSLPGPASDPTTTFPSALPGPAPLPTRTVPSPVPTALIPVGPSPRTKATSPAANQPTPPVNALRSLVQATRPAPTAKARVGDGPADPSDPLATIAESDLTGPQRDRTVAANPPSPGVSADAALDPLQLGKALFRSGDYQSAGEAFRRVDPQALTPENRLLIRYLLATCLRKQGRNAEASSLYQELVRTNDPFISDYAKWQLDSMQWTEHFDQQRDKLRKLPRASLAD